MTKINKYTLELLASALAAGIVLGLALGVGAWMEADRQVLIQEVKASFASRASWELQHR